MITIDELRTKYCTKCRERDCGDDGKHLERCFFWTNENATSITFDAVSRTLPPTSVTVFTTGEIGKCYERFRKDWNELYEHAQQKTFDEFQSSREWYRLDDFYRDVERILKADGLLDEQYTVYYFKCSADCPQKAI